MDFSNAIQNAIQVVKGDQKMIKKVSTDKTSTKWGLIILLIAGLLSGIGSIGSQEGNIIGNIIGSIIGLILASFILTFVYWIIAKLFKGKGNYMENWRAIAFMMIIGCVGILNLIPGISGVLSVITFIWETIILIIIIKVIHSLTTGKAIVVWLIPTIIIFILVLSFIGTILAALGLGALASL